MPVCRCSSGAATSEIAALAQSGIASLSSQNVFALEQVTSFHKVV